MIDSNDNIKILNFGLAPFVPIKRLSMKAPELHSSRGVSVFKKEAFKLLRYQMRYVQLGAICYNMYDDMVGYMGTFYLTEALYLKY